MERQLCRLLVSGCLATQTNVAEMKRRVQWGRHPLCLVVGVNLAASGPWQTWAW